MDQRHQGKWNRDALILLLSWQFYIKGEVCLTFTVQAVASLTAHSDEETNPCILGVTQCLSFFGIWPIMKPEVPSVSPINKGGIGEFDFYIHFLKLWAFFWDQKREVACPIRPLTLAPARSRGKHAWVAVGGETIQHRLVGNKNLWCTHMGAARQECCKWPHPAVPQAEFRLSDFPKGPAYDSSLLSKFLFACSVKKKNMILYSLN